MRSGSKEDSNRCAKLERLQVSIPLNVRRENTWSGFLNHLDARLGHELHLSVGPAIHVPTAGISGVPASRPGRLRTGRARPFGGHHLTPRKPAEAAPKPIAVANSGGWGTSVSSATVGAPTFQCRHRQLQPNRPKPRPSRSLFPIPAAGAPTSPADVIYDAPAKPAEAAPKPIQVSDTGGWGMNTPAADVIYDAPAKPRRSRAQADPGSRLRQLGHQRLRSAGACCTPAVQVSPQPLPWGAAMVIPSGPPPVLQTPYILDTGDKLRIFVYGQPNLSRLYTVDQIGIISVPLIGDGARARHARPRASSARSPRGSARDTCAIRRSPSTSRRTGRSSSSARCGCPANIPTFQRHDGRDRRRHRRRLRRARQRAPLPHHPPRSAA